MNFLERALARNRARNTGQDRSDDDIATALASKEEQLLFVKDLLESNSTVDDQGKIVIGLPPEVKNEIGKALAGLNNKIEGDSNSSGVGCDPLARAEAARRMSFGDARIPDLLPRSRIFNVSVQKIKSFVLGGHGDSMVAMLESTIIEGKKIKDLIKEGKITQEKIDKIIDRTKKGGAEIVKYLEKGSAFYAPAASGVEMAESYLKDQKKQLPCAVYLDGQYGAKDIYAGVPVIIGKNGVEQVVEIQLSQKEKEDFDNSIKSVQELFDAAKKIDTAL